MDSSAATAIETQWRICSQVSSDGAAGEIFKWRIDRVGDNSTAVAGFVAVLIVIAI